MNTHADNTQGDKCQSEANTVSQNQRSDESSFLFVDNRPEANTQRKLQEIANNSSQVKRLRALQEMANSSPRAKQAAQFQAMANRQPFQQAPAQKKKNNTGLPDNLKSGIENLSGCSMDDVKVHYNSGKPAQLNAHAYAQGVEIHLGVGQEKHLPHEAWHVVQQKQGRVKPTMQMAGNVNISEDCGLEKEADTMGAKANGYRSKTHEGNILTSRSSDNLVQRKVIVRIRTKKPAGDGEREISEVRIEGRAPTDVDGSAQGDHTVASTLINESVRAEMIRQQRKMALNNINVLASITLDEPDKTEMETLFDDLWERFQQLEGEEQNAELEDFAQKYIELANKRKMTAFSRKDKLTHGLTGQRRSITHLRGWAELQTWVNEVGTQSQDIEEEFPQIAEAIVNLIDIKYCTKHQDVYIKVVKRGANHSINSILFNAVRTEQQKEILVDYITKELQKRDEFTDQARLAITNSVLEHILHENPNEDEKS